MEDKFTLEFIFVEGGGCDMCCLTTTKMCNNNLCSTEDGRDGHIEAIESINNKER